MTIPSPLIEAISFPLTTGAELFSQRMPGLADLIMFLCTMHELAAARRIPAWPQLLIELSEIVTVEPAPRTAIPLLRFPTNSFECTATNFSVGPTAIPSEPLNWNRLLRTSIVHPSEDRIPSFA